MTLNSVTSLFPFINMNF